MQTLFKQLKILSLVTVLLSGFTFAQELLVSGTFVGQDKNHPAEGGFEIVTQDGERVLKFLEDFRGTGGPDLFVLLRKNNSTQESVRLGRLQQTKGAQEYAIPEDVNLDDFDIIVIWCRAFSFWFATAEFEFSDQ